MQWKKKHGSAHTHPAFLAVEHVSKVVNYVRKSVFDTETINSSVGFRFKAKNVTRWNSQPKMVETFLKALQIDRHLQSKLKATKKLGELSPHEISILNELCILLKPFETATDVLQGDYETTGNVIPCYLGMLMKVSATIKDASGKLYTNPDCPLSNKIKSCKFLAATLEDSLKRRLGYVLRDMFDVLGRNS